MSILIEEWMIGGMLGLKGCELLVFAYAYSFYRNGKKLFASEGNLGSLICYSRKQVGLALREGVAPTFGEQAPRA